MADDDSGQGDPSRRDYLKYGGAVVGGGLLAGCSSGQEPAATDAGTEAASATASASATKTPTEPPETSDESTAEGESYSVTMSPVGTVEFEAVPERIFTRLSHHAGMAFALGRGDDVNALNGDGYYHETWQQFTARLPGVSVDWSDVYPSWQVSKEQLYELDSDVHLADPAWVVQLESWDMDDIDEVAENIAPWFGNSLSSHHQSPSEEWTGEYEYYTLWEQFEKVAQVFKAEAQYEALAEIHADVLETLERKLPPESERPSSVLISTSDLENIWVYTMGDPGFVAAHSRPLKAHDAFEGSVESGSKVDFEALLDADPDVIQFEGGMQPEISMDEVRAELESDPVASQISAVKNDRVHPLAARFQGPILNLFQLEMCAKQFYPDAFGAFPDYDTGAYPEIPADERLFDRQRVADIINDDF